LRALAGFALAVLPLVLAATAQAAAPSCQAEAPDSTLLLFRGDARLFLAECSDAEGDLASVTWSTTLASDPGATQPAANASDAGVSRLVAFDETGNHTVRVEATDRTGAASAPAEWAVAVKEPAAPGVGGAAPACSAADATDPTAAPLAPDAEATLRVLCQDADNDLFRLEWRVDRGRAPESVSDVDPRGVLETERRVSFHDNGSYLVEAIAVDLQGHRSEPVGWTLRVGAADAAASPSPAQGGVDWTSVFTVVAAGITIVGGAIVGIVKLWRKKDDEGADEPREVPVQGAQMTMQQRVGTNTGTIVTGHTVYVGAPAPRPEGGVPPEVHPRLKALYQALDDAQEPLDAHDAGRETREAREILRNVLQDLARGERPRAELRDVAANAIEAALAHETSPKVRAGEAALRLAVARLRE